MGGAFDQRGGGAGAAAEAGVMGCWSADPCPDTLPHTGSLRYKGRGGQVARCRHLHRRCVQEPWPSLIAGPGSVQVKMRLNSQDLGTVEQGQRGGEWRGSEFPDEIITLGGHLDSWDIGEGAHDDGPAWFHTLEALRA